MPQKQSNLKLILAAFGALVVLGTTVYAIVDSTAKVDSAIITHDSCETAHPGIRKAIKTNTELVSSVKYTVDSLLIENRHFQKDISKDIDEVLKRLKQLNGEHP